MKSERRKTREDTWKSEDLTKVIRAAQVDAHKDEKVREKTHHSDKGSNFADSEERRHHDKERDGYKEKDRERHKSRERHRSKEMYRDRKAEEERTGAGGRERHKESFRERDRENEIEKTREKDGGKDHQKYWDQEKDRDKERKRDQEQEKNRHTEMDKELKREREERIKEEERTRKHREKREQAHENDTSNESYRRHPRFQNEDGEHKYREFKAEDKILLDKEQGRRKTKHEKEMSRKPKEQKDIDNQFKERVQDQKQRGVKEESHASTYKNLEEQHKEKRAKELQSGERDRARKHTEQSKGRNTESDFGGGNQKGREEQQERKDRSVKEKSFDRDEKKRHQEKKGRDEKDLIEEFADGDQNRKFRKRKEGNFEGQSSDRDQEKQHRERKERRDIEGQFSERDREKRHRERKERKERDVEGQSNDKDQEMQHKERRERDRERRHREKKERKEREMEGQSSDEDEKRRRKEKKERKRDVGRQKEHKESKDGEDLERNNTTKEDEKEEIIIEDAPTTEQVFEADYEEDFEQYDDDFEEDDGEGGDKTEDERESTSTHTNPEIEEIRRAIIAENERISRVPTARNQQVNAEQTKSAKEATPSGSSRGTFFDFVAAKQRQVSHQMANKQKKRITELLRLVDLDFSVTFSLMDLPPVSEYDMYIKNFGRTNTKQAYVQYNDDNLDRDIQTDEVETLEKWTQFPAAGAVVCGGPTSDSDLSLDFLSTTRIDTPRLTNFLRSACQVMSVLIEEDRAEMQPSQIFKSKGTSLSVCDGCFQFNTNLPFLHDREVHSLSLSLVQRQTIISVHGLPRKPSAVRLDSKFILCVWNIWEPSSPQKVLICESEVRCCCFSPGKPTLVFAGTVDGSVVLWDLRERSSLHHTMKIGDFEWIFREPTFCTDGILSTVNHSCPVQAIETISIAAADGKHHSLSFSVPHEESSGLSFQLASLDESGLLNLWVVVELPKADIAGSQLDLGLIPGGKVKLIHSSRINMNSNILQMGAHLGVLQTSSLKFLPSDPNHFIMGTDTGLVSHGTRHGLRTSPRLYKPQQNGPRPVQVTCLNFCPFEETLFLVGCSDGSVRLHRTTSEYPVFQWNDSTEGQPVVFLQWSFTRPAVFFILDAESYIYTWDLLDNDMQPVAQELIQSDKVTTIAVLGDPEKPNALSGLVLAKQSGTIEIQYLNKRWTVIQHEELKKLHKILQFAI